MNRCKTCKHWSRPDDGEWRLRSMCNPLDPDTYEPMDRGFLVAECTMPTQTFYEAPVERDGFGLTDGSEYFAALCTAEDFGCVKWEAK